MHHILSLTSESYVQTMSALFGKGARHAQILYRDFFQIGQLTARDPAFGNAGELFKQLCENTRTNCLEVARVDSDGETGKILYRTEDGHFIESVMIPMKHSSTLCVSSQVGCRLGCRFCETGRMGLVRHLRPEEIVAQVFVAKHQLEFTPRNIVFMGMGEPFDNFDAVDQAIQVLTDPFGLGYGPSRITVSTVGRVDGIAKLRKGVNLAVSINAPNDEIRKKLMPINRKIPMKELKEAIIEYHKRTKKQVLIAYVLLKGINDTLECADELTAYLEGLSVKVNVIPYNPQKVDRYQPPEEEVIDAFLARLRGHGLRAFLRGTKGDKVMAACGQLKPQGV